VRARRLPLLGALVALCGCGGGDSPQEVAYAFVSTDDPAKCELVLPELLERQTGRRGEAALDFCRENVGRTPPPTRVRVIESEQVADQVLVELVVDEREERLALVKRGGSWRIADFPR